MRERLFKKSMILLSPLVNKQDFDGNLNSFEKDTTIYEAYAGVYGCGV